MQSIGASDIESPRLAYGCMRILGTWNPAEITAEREASAMASLRAAYEAGYTLFDHADIYCQGECERVHGNLLRSSPELRRQTTTATKCGIRREGTPSSGDPGRYDFSRDWIIESCLGSIKRLGVDQIDIYQLHRPDILMDPAEVLEAFSWLFERGLVRWFGVSNFLPSSVALLQQSLPWPLVVNQVEISLNRLDCFTDGTLDQCLQKNMTPLSWGPLGGGRFGELEGHLEKVATYYETTPAVIALSWLLKHPSKIVPIVGSTNPSRIAEAMAALSVDLSREDWYHIYIAARGAKMP